MSTYEFDKDSGFCFLVTVKGPEIASIIKDENESALFEKTQKEFIDILEREFYRFILNKKDNIYTDNDISLLNTDKDTNQLSTTIDLVFSKDSESIVSNYLRLYNTTIREQFKSCHHPENLFNFLYIITDSTCLKVEESFLILDANPSAVYNKPPHSSTPKNISINFSNSFIISNDMVKRIAQEYITNITKIIH